LGAYRAPLQVLAKGPRRVSISDFVRAHYGYTPWYSYQSRPWVYTTQMQPAVWQQAHQLCPEDCSVWDECMSMEAQVRGRATARLMALSLWAMLKHLTSGLIRTHLVSRSALPTTRCSRPFTASHGTLAPISGCGGRTARLAARPTTASLRQESQPSASCTITGHEEIGSAQGWLHSGKGLVAD